MTATDPQSLTAALDDLLNNWHGETGQRPPLALFCAEAHPSDEATLCRRLDGHTGLHSSDGLDAWTEPNDDEKGSR